MAPVGLTVPKLLPITATFAAPFSLYYMLLSYRVVAQRLKCEKYMGDTSSSTPNKHDPLQVCSRAQLNFNENVPLAFILLSVCELNGGNRQALTYVMSVLLALRVAHADLGLMLEGNFGDNGVGRPIGYFGTLGVLGGLGGYAAWLVKGYWGF